MSSISMRRASGSVIVPPPRAALVRAAVGPVATSPRLPAWPLLALMYGFPLFWVTGLSLFAPLILGGTMAVFLVLRGSVRTTPAVLCWFAFLLWVGVCAVSVTGFMQLVGFGQRAADLLAVGIAMLYYVNARESVSARQVLTGFTVLWSTVIVLGVLATQFPDVRITTPLAQVIPGSLMGNELVRELVTPRLAEVQDPWGAEQPFVRPAAPFPYTNSWGMAYALLTPLMVLVWTRLRTWKGRVLLGIALVVSIYPAAQTSNRGMLLALAMFALFVAGRFVLAGHLKAGLGVVGLLTTAGAAAAAAGVFEAIAERQEVSHTTDGRGRIYQATFEKVLESPVVGWATPGMDPSIGIALGTQGYAWTLLYSYGFIGLMLFYLVLARVLLSSWTLREPAAYVLQGLVATVGCSIWFYGLGVTQCLILLLSAGMLSRATVDGGIDHG
ncbi:O-antigen ligase family protein [Brachybacterium sp. UNK5269]|uniref:O-antigen ligase family protein n=1 Tax=Brachybacterium sp. UNK5269 TaxID=3408576 RepID=UPI003BB088D9